MSQILTMFVTSSTLSKQGILYRNPIQRTVPSISSTPEHYHIIPMEYKYDVNNELVTDDLVMEGCMMQSWVGIRSRVRSDRSPKYEITGTFHPKANESTELFIKAVSEIYSSSGLTVESYKSLLRLYHFNSRNLEQVMANPIKYKTDNSTGEVLQDSSAYMTLKLLGVGGGGEQDSLFTDLDDKEISWKCLANVFMCFIPIIRFKEINVTGCRPTIRMELVRAIVTHVVIPNRKYDQSATMSRLKAENQIMAVTLKRNLSIINETRHITPESPTTSNNSVLFPPPQCPEPMINLTSIENQVPSKQLLPIELIENKAQSMQFFPVQLV